eukprot:gene20028-26005_t
MGLSIDNDINDTLDRIDSDGSSEIDLNEWLEYWIKRVSKNPNPLKQQEVIARNTFSKYDADNSGYLDANELSNVLTTLGADFTDEEMLLVINELDSDNSNLIEIEEFVSWWTGRTVKNRQSTSLVSLKLKKLSAKASQIFSTDIFTAVWNGDINLVKAFIQADNRLAVATDSTEKGDNWTPLHYASYKGFINIVELLIDNISVISTAVNTTNTYGFTPLFYSAQNNHIEICKLLLDKGADPSICGIHFDNPDIFMCPASFAEDSIELKELLLTHSRCTPPRAISTKNISVSIVKSGQLTIELPNQRFYTNLPIKHYEIGLAIKDNNTTMTINSKAPNISQVYTVNFDKKWFNNVLSTLYNDNSISPAITLVITGVNVMNMNGITSEDVSIDLSTVLKEYSDYKSNAQPISTPKSDNSNKPNSIKTNNSSKTIQSNKTNSSNTRK